MALESLEDSVHDFLDRFAEELLGRRLEQLGRGDDLALGHARDCQRHSLGCLDVLAHWCDRHNLDRRKRNKKKM
jgi:hypothetical protein